jgi:hypothetical protein
VFRLKAEVYKTSRKARIKPFKTFPVSLANRTCRARVRIPKICSEIRDNERKIKISADTIQGGLRARVGDAPNLLGKSLFIERVAVRP